MKEIQPDILGDHREHHAVYRSLLAAIVSVSLADEHRRQRVEMWQRPGDDLSQAHARGIAASASEYVVWHARREQYRAAYRAFFKEWDVLLSPAINMLPYHHIERPWPSDDSDITITVPIDGAAVPYLHGLVYPSVATLAGQPATAFPGRPLARRTAHRPPGHRSLPGGPDPDPLRRSARQGDRRLSPTARLRRRVALASRETPDAARSLRAALG